MTDLATLIEAMQQGTATLADRDRLEGLLRDPANRTVYLQASRLHAELLWRWHRERSGVVAPEEAGRGSERLPLQVAAPAAGRPSGPSRGAAAAFAGLAEWLARQARGLARPVPLVLLVAGGLLSVMLGIATRESRQSPAAPQALEANAVAARVTGLYEAKWRNPKASFAVADPLAAGATLDLASGLVEIRYVSGATVLLEGPAVLRVEGRAAASLAAGRLTAKFEKTAAKDDGSRSAGQLPRLFTVHTPKAAVHDLGTEFGIEVRPSGKADVHVFDGLVELAAVDPVAAATQAPVQLLAAGHAARIDEAGGIAPAGDTGLAFVRSLPAQRADAAHGSESRIPWDDATAEVLYRDTFQGSGALDGTSPASRGGVGAAAWRASSASWGRLEPSGERPGLQVTGGGHALLPFRPEPGYVYKLTIELDVTAGGVHGLGFGMRAEIPSRYTLNVAAAGQRHDCAVGWSIFRQNPCFPGPGNEWRLLGDQLGGRQTRAVLLDTTGDRWRVAYEVGGRLLAEHVYDANPTMVEHIGCESSSVKHVRGHVFSFTLARNKPLPESL